MKTQLKKFIMCALCALTVAVSAVPVVTYCDVPNTSQNQQEATGGSDMFDVGENVISGLQKDITDLSMAVCPLSLIIGLLLLMFTKDAKKVSGILWFLGIVVVATGGILLVNGGYVISTIQNILGISV